jgi:5-formyltetrahydrofolate cyclo-ligase
MDSRVSHGIPGDKVSLRLTQESRLAGLTPSTRREETAALVSFLGSWARSRGFEVVLATLPLPGELDLTPFLSSWLAGGHSVALARTGPGRTLGFRYIPSLDGPWDPRPFGLREPPLTAAPWEPGRPTLCLVPGLAFAPAGPQGTLRLGRGGGYYDRWLEKHQDQVFSLGVGFSVQTVSDLPREPHDRLLDAWWDGSALRGGPGG